MIFLLLFAELLVLYFFSRWVTTQLFDLFFLIFRSRTVAIAITLVLQFPGTVVHELAHLFTAEILGVRTGKLSFEPESLRGANITSGSVMIAETDPFRRYTIGLAPIFIGIIMLATLSYFLSQPYDNVLLTALLFYLLFAVSNTMFSSPQDLKGFLPFVAVIAVFVAAFYFIGIRIAITGVVLTTITNIVTTLVYSLGIVLGINAVLLIIALFITYLLTKIFHVRIIH